MITHHVPSWVWEEIWSFFRSIHPVILSHCWEMDSQSERMVCWQWKEIVDSLLQIHHVVSLQKSFLFQENKKSRDRNCWWPRSRKRKAIQVCASKIQGRVLNIIFHAFIDDGVQMIFSKCAHDTKLRIWTVYFFKTNHLIKCIFLKKEYFEKCELGRKKLGAGIIFTVIFYSPME